MKPMSKDNKESKSKTGDKHSWSVLDELKDETKRKELGITKTFIEQLNNLSESELVKLLGQKLENLSLTYAEAGVIFCLIYERCLEKDVDGYTYVQKLLGCSHLTCVKLHKVGKGELLPQLAEAKTPGEIALSKTPIAVQRQFIDRPVPVEVRDRESGKFVTEFKPLNKLSKKESARAFHNGLPTPMEEQRRIFDSQRTPARTQMPEPQPIIELDLIRGTVLLRAAHRLSLVQAEKFLDNFTAAFEALKKSEMEKLKTKATRAR